MSDATLTDASESNTTSELSEASSTKQSREKQLKYWYGTHHLQFDQHDDKFKAFIEKQKQYIYGFEICPTTKRHHWQFYFESCNKSGIRKSTLIKDHPKTKFLICDGTKEANFKYCSKDKNYKTNIIDVYVPSITPDIFFQWEKDIINIITNKPDDRLLYWYWEPKGCAGKTTFAKYLSVYHNAIPLRGKTNDILHCAAEHPSQLYIFISPRTNEDYFPYEGLELVKDGYFMSGKYESKPITRPCPHVFIFANFPPNEHKMSPDKWKIVDITDQL